MSEEKEKELLKMLKEMPDIQDDKSKDELFNNISSQVNVDKKVKQKRFRVSPLIAALSALILIVLGPIILNNNVNQFADRMTGMNEGSDMATENSVSISESDEDSQYESYDYSEEEELFLEPNFVLNNISDDEDILHLTIYDEELEYILPLALIVSDDEEMIYFYDTVEQYLTEFRHYGLDQVSIYPNNIASDLEDLTEFEETTIEEASYLLFDNRFFIAIPQAESSSISTAINSLKLEDPEMNISHTIPENINFSIKENEDTLHVILDNTSSASSNDISVTMIESILLTAKSYGFTHVMFENMPFSFIGDYNLEESLEVPLAANPIFY
ncbi:hypothetical protein [Oceanobacillus sp. CAU 1775]